jgi:hypothetical protein
MNSLELLETYDKAAAVIKRYYLEFMLESLNNDNLPDNFKDFVREQGIDNDKIAAIIDSAPRGLFDVFDDHGVYIEILLDYKESVIFTYTVRDLDVMYTEPIKYNTRKEAELTAVTEAFKLLNDKL